MGLGCLISFVLFILYNDKVRLRYFYIIIFFFCLIPNILTFSRGGVYLAFISIIIFSVFLLKDHKYRKRIFIVVLFLLILTTYLLFPFLNDFTNGALDKRIFDISLSQRDKILISDLEIFFDNIILGVGPGVAKYHRSQIISLSASAHTEFSRMLAEHGLPGAISIFCFVLIIKKIINKPKQKIWRAIVFSITIWVILYMIINAMRLAMPAFLIGLLSSDLLDFKRISIETKNSRAYDYK